ncbi:MAG TPA: SpoIIE family protein phosphatase [Thermoanaerobaculaceae bacterium]|nr:SpoIIE family protein phosphatase [Thermoanaerobaculaceae bacterium]
MASLQDTYIVPQLRERRRRLELAVESGRESGELQRLLGEVDAALARVDAGSYGLCEFCHDPIESERLLADPLLRFCLDHLSPDERRALEHDLETAAGIQRGLLPEPTLRLDGWHVHYRYEPAGPVSGDYCDLIRPHDDPRGFYFLFGDVSGKGVAAAMLMAHLHATFRNLLAGGRDVHRLVERANRVFRESTLAPYFATLVCGRAESSGALEICNAGHCPPLVLSRGKVGQIEPTGLPVGAFRDVSYGSRSISLGAGDSLVLYTDGLSEARDAGDREYGAERIAAVAAAHAADSPERLADACFADLASHLGGAARSDDLTLMVLRRAG